MKIETVILFLICFFTHLGLPLSAQPSLSEDRIKGGLIYYITDFIEWPGQNNQTTFNIGILGNRPELLNELQLVSNSKKIKGKQIQVIALKTITFSQPIHLLFVDKSYYDDIGTLYFYCREHNILLVTDNLINKLYSHLNFINVASSQSIGFEVNKQNLLLSGFNYKDELLLYGGTIIDIKELYSTTQKQLETQTLRVDELNRKITLTSIELDKKNRSIDSLSQSIKASQATLSKLSETIAMQNSEKDLQTQLLLGQFKQVEKAKSEIEHLKEIEGQQISEIKNKEESIQDLDAEINYRENIIKEQLQTLNLKNDIINAKNRIMYLLIFLGGSLLLSGVLIFRALKIKQKYNLMLEAQVNERTKELNESNQQLRDEIMLRKKSEEELKKSERNYREIFDAAADSMFVYGLSFKLLDANQAAINTFGFSKTELLNGTLSQISAPEKGLNVMEAQNWFLKAKNEGKQTFDWKAKNKAGDEFWVEATMQKAIIGGVGHMLLIIRDIDEKKKNQLELDQYRQHLEQMITERTTELRQVNEELFTTNESLTRQKDELQATVEKLQKTQEQLVESEKMASIGMLAAGVAHEINNPLNFIQGGILGIETYLETFLPSHLPKMEVMLEGLKTGVMRAASIVTSLNHFSRQSANVNEICNVHGIIDNCLTMLANSTKHRISIVKEFSDADFVLKGNEGKLHQAILNILTNAVQAIEGNGQITISTKHEKNAVQITIADTGSGIDKNILSKVMEPFFTTKDPGKGTGLGLSITQKIIAEHHGRIKIDSEIGKGTEVSISLPVQT